MVSNKATSLAQMDITELAFERCLHPTSACSFISKLAEDEALSSIAREVSSYPNTYNLFLCFGEYWDKPGLYSLCIDPFMCC